MKESNFARVINICSNLLENSPIAHEARCYLDNRLSKSSQKKFGFGFFPPQEDLNVLLSFIDKEDLFKQNLIYEKNIEDRLSMLFSPMEQHNLIMPYRDVSGAIIAIVGRSLLDDEHRTELRISKYKNTSFEKSRNLFGLFESKYSIIEKNCVYIVEGQFDCIQAHDKNIRNVVALGSSNMSMEQLILLLRYTNNINLLLDNDEAGELGRERIIEKFGRFANIKNYRLPQGFKDLDELLKEVEIIDDDLEQFLRQ